MLLCLVCISAANAEETRIDSAQQYEPALIYPYAPYNQGKMDPQLSGWPLSKSELAYVEAKAAGQRWPGSEPGGPGAQAVLDMVPVTPIAGGSKGYDKALKTSFKFLQETHAVDILLVGDSITGAWEGYCEERPFIPAWTKQFGSYKTINLGKAGENTAGTLWRMDHAPFGHLVRPPRVCILQTGHNNMYWLANGVSKEAVTQGIVWCVKNLRNRFPQTPLILVNVFPMKGIEKPDSFREGLIYAHKRINELNLPARDPMIQVLDLWDDMSKPDGSQRAELFTDGIHPSAEGYALWAAKLKPIVEKILSSDAPAASRQFSELRVDAVDFDKSFGAMKWTVGQDFADVHSCIWNGGAEYEVDIPVAADYTLSALYAGSDIRPVEISINGKPVYVGFNDKTGDHYTMSAQWFDQFTMPLPAGPCRIAFKPKGSMPHFCAFKLRTPARFPQGNHRSSFAADPGNYLTSRGDLLARTEKILYKRTPQEDLYFYLMRPHKAPKAPLPVIVYFSGGGWNANNVTWTIQECAWFRDHGIIAIAADYRVAGRHKTGVIEAVNDAKSAVRFVRAHARELGVDPKRIIAAGGSAGGHIAACTALPGSDQSGEDLSISSRADALVLCSPVLGKGFNEGFFDMNPQFSPLEAASGKGWPPVILVSGTADTISPHATAEDFAKRMKEAGNTCELIPIPEGGHGPTWPVTQPAFEPTFTRVVTFLREQGFIPND